MFSYQLYKLVHILGLAILLTALGGLALTTADAGSSDAPRRRRLVLGFHGLGVFLILLGGFGMLARLGIVQGSSWPGWVWAKFGVWILLAVAALIPMRFPAASRPLLFIVPLLAGLAAYFAIYKPL